MKEIAAQSLDVTGWTNSLSLAIGNIREFNDNFQTMCSLFLTMYKTKTNAIRNKDSIRNSLKEVVLTKDDRKTLSSKV
jgi:hypothetical protein